jgi:hypothetical protein
MPFVLIVVGILFLVVAIQGTQATMFSLLKKEFVGTNSFVPWAAAIIILGLIGYAKPVRPITDAMIGLVLFVMLIANKGGVFAQFNNALQNPVAPTIPAQQGFTQAGASLASGTSLAPATANANAASLTQGQTLGETPSPQPPASATPSFLQELFGFSGAQ